MESLRVSLVAGCVVERDAISNVCRQQAEGIERVCREKGVPVDVKIFTTATDIEDTRIFEVPNVLSLATDDHFLRSDVVVFQYGIQYPLFEAIHLTPSHARVIVCYYGITSPCLLPEHDREAIYDSYTQAISIHAAHQVVTTSRYLEDQLRDIFEVPSSKIAHLPLSAPFRQTPETRGPRKQAGVTRLLYVGRFAEAKGVHELLEAFRVCHESGLTDIRLNLVGSTRWVDDGYLNGLTTFVRKHELESVVEFHFDVSNEYLAQSMLRSDALIIPSHHEGFCVPVIEAMMCGCPVLSSDAGALPETSGGLGRTFPASDTGTLAARLGEFVETYPNGVHTDSGYLTMEEWASKCEHHLAQFTTERYEQDLCTILFSGLQTRRQPTVTMLAEAKNRLLRSLGGQELSSPVNRKYERFFQEVLKDAGNKVA